MKVVIFILDCFKSSKYYICSEAINMCFRIHVRDIMLNSAEESTGQFKRMIHLYM
jgi:hypothetical protein